MNEPSREGLLAQIEELYNKLSNSPLGMASPWERKASAGKPLLYGGKRGLLAYGTIATWDEFDLIAAVINALPVILATPSKATEPSRDDEDRMEKISGLIARLQSTKDQFGDTCVYIRRGGLSWGAVALNRRADDEKHGVFDLQDQHDRDMLELLEKIERLKASRNDAEMKLNEALARLAAKPAEDVKEIAPQKVCLYSDGCPMDGPICHLCEHVQPHPAEDVKA